VASVQRRRPAFGSALAGLAFACALTLPFVAADTASAAVPLSPRGWSRAVVIQNAQRWVDQAVPYSQTSWYRGYRQDCSGFVSMAWNVHASYPTGMMSEIAKPIPKDALLPGDILLNNSSSYAHVVLFAGWAYSDKSAYVGYEQLSSTNRPVRRVIPYPYPRHPELYAPYCFTGLPPKPPAPKPAEVTPAPLPVSRAVAASAAPVATRELVPFAWRFAFVLALACVGGLAWSLTGRYLE
jgi:hypothetical protein